MFKENTNHLQGNLLSFENDLSSQQKKQVRFKEAEFFYQNVFCQIVEDDFSVLYSDDYSRPNSPINSMVSCLILREKNHWTFEQLFDHLYFDLLLKKSLGLSEINDIPFCYTTIFNFQKRLLEYYESTGNNLIENVFKKLTKKELKKLKLSTSIQRTDSTLISSNIRKYSRLQLLIETLIRLDRILTEEDRLFVFDELIKYTKQKSMTYIYSLSSSDLPHEFNKLGELYHKLYTHLKVKNQYQLDNIFNIFERVYNEQFRQSEDKIILIPPKELGSGILQSPDDLDATYRKKGDEESRGHKINAVETANPDNELQLITDVAVTNNNVDDTTILADRLESIMDITPDLNEFHTDGGYGNEENDNTFKELGINHIQTAIKGREASIEITIEQSEDSNEYYIVKCPYQEVKSQKTRKRYKAVFNKELCSNCQLHEECKIYQKHKSVYYFKQKDYLLSKRRRSLYSIPVERRKLRNNAEATMHEFKCKTNHKGKLKVRGIFKTMLFAFNTAISINFGRIFRYLYEILVSGGILSKLFRIVVAMLHKIALFFKIIPINVILRKNSKITKMEMRINRTMKIGAF